MHGFIILCLAVATTADQLGYNYQPGGQTASAEGVGLTGNEAGDPDSIDIRFGGSSSGASNAHGGGLSGFGNSINAAGFGGSGVGGNAIGFGGSGAGGFNTIGGGSGINSNPTHTEFNKEFYTYSAPEEDFNDHENGQQIAGYAKKNLRVVFIRAPENQGLTKAALQLAKQASEDRTAIYVLTKQADIGSLANQLQTINSAKANKPEVHFVKYRTPEEAVHAQQVIQAQYDSLGGPSHSSNEGVAPVLNFASPPSSGAFSGSGNGNGIGAAGGLSGNGGYLPPAHRRA